MTADAYRKSKNAKYDYARKLGAEVEIDMDGFNSYINNSVKNAPDDLFAGYTPGVDTHIDKCNKGSLISVWNHIDPKPNGGCAH